MLDLGLFLAHDYVLNLTIGAIGLLTSQTHEQNFKLMLTLSPETYHQLDKIARSRGVTLQELLRAIIIPKWLRENPE